MNDQPEGYFAFDDGEPSESDYEFRLTTDGEHTQQVPSVSEIVLSAEEGNEAISNGTAEDGRTGYIHLRKIPREGLHFVDGVGTPRQSTLESVENVLKVD